MEETGAALPFGFDPLSRTFRADPWDTYERVREEDPAAGPTRA
jgi:hypothetical protein